MSWGLFSSILTSVAVSVMTVNMVASLPVPAVVGMAAMGTKGPSMTLPIKSRSRAPGYFSSTAAAFIRSMGLPPPTAIIKSQPPLK